MTTLPMTTTHRHQGAISRNQRLILQANFITEEITSNQLSAMKNRKFKAKARR